MPGGLFKTALQLQQVKVRDRVRKEKKQAFLLYKTAQIRDKSLRQCAENAILLSDEGEHPPLFCILCRQDGGYGMNEMALTEGKVKTTLLRFTLPFLAATLLQFLYGAADLIIVGQFANAAGVSAVSTGSQIMQMFTGLAMGLASGGTVIVGQYWGARRREDVQETIGTMFCFFTLFALAMTAFILLFVDPIIAVMNVPEEAKAPAWDYIFICGCGTIFITGYNMVSGILRGMGDSKRPMYFVMVACVVNVVGDLILVGGFGMGAAGAAIATVASQALSLLLSVLVLRRKDFPFDFKRASFRIHRDKLISLVKLGTPVAIQNILVSLSFLIITAIVNNIGLVESAAVGTAGRIGDFGLLGPIAFLSAISAMVAQNIGAGREDRAKATLKYGILFSLVFGVVMFVLLQLFPQGAMSIFNNDQRVIEAGALYLRSFCFDSLLTCFVFSLNGFFGGCGRTGFALANSVLATFLVRVPVVLIVSLIPDTTIFHIGMATPLASAFQVVVQLIYYRLGRWKGAVLVQEGAPADES